VFIFYRLLLAHFLAEFPLQFDLIYRLKVSKRTGVWLHSFIFFLVALLLLLPWWNIFRFWVFMIFLLFTHYLLDRLKVSLSRKNQVDNVVIFLLDQLGHIGCISLVFFVGLDQTRGLHLLQQLNALTVLYQSNQVVVYLIGYLFATFGASFLVYYLQKCFFANRIDRGFLTSTEKYYSIFGGLVITTLALFKGFYFLLIPLVPVSQWYLFSLRKDADKKAPTIFALITNAVVAALIGFILRRVSANI
jgi:hypothetical protein